MLGFVLGFVLGLVLGFVLGLVLDVVFLVTLVDDDFVSGVMMATMVCVVDVVAKVTMAVSDVVDAMGGVRATSAEDHQESHRDESGQAVFHDCGSLE